MIVIYVNRYVLIFVKMVYYNQKKHESLTILYWVHLYITND